MFFFIKDFQATAWNTKNINLGGTSLTHINFANIGGEIKLLDTLKYYQKSLAQLTSTLFDKEKIEVKKVAEQFFNQHNYFFRVWRYLSPQQKEKVLNIIAEGKGTFPYEKIVDANSMFITPENSVFFEKNEFCSKLKQKRVSDNDYESSFYLYKTLKMKNLGDMNDLYNAQDVILLCEIIENRFQLMHENHGFNPRRCNSASTLSGSIKREMSKVIIVLPTSKEVVDIFEKTLTGGFSCVNTRLAFVTGTLLPNSTDENNNDDLNKDYNNKVCYQLKLDDEKDYLTRRVIRKILKLHENNQYGFAMTKPMATGCIKREPDPTWRTFNLLMESVDLEDPIDHLFIVDIEFDYEQATSRQRVYNEIFPPIIEKQKIIAVCERSVYQLLEQYTENNSGQPKSYRPTKKAHAALFKKRFQPMYVEQLAFVIKRAGWKVTKLYSHYSFKQERFKKKFILMNQKSRQSAKNRRKRFL